MSQNHTPRGETPPIAPSMTPDSLQAESPQQGTPGTWRSIAEFEGDESVAAFAAREFPTDDFDRLESPDRRRFMQVLGASAALAGASSCRWEREEIMPFAVRPEDAVPGQRTVYSSVMDLAGCARPLRVESADGRPIKIEHNPLTADIAGAGTDLFSQAAILGFYDPDRSRAVKHGAGDGAGNGTWSAATAAVRGIIQSSKGAVLASTHSSPTLHRLADAARAAGVRWTWYSPVDRERSIEGTRLAFGRALRTRYDLAKASVVLSLDSDFQRDHHDAPRLAGGLASRRMPENGDLSRIYAVEARFTSSGLSSDHRLPLRASDVGSFVELIAAKIEGAAPSAAATALAARGKVGIFADAVADDLKHAGKHAAIVVGEAQPAEVHARVHQLLAGLGAHGTTTLMTEEPLAAAGGPALKELALAINAGQVDGLVILEGNPVYDAPADLNFGAALAKVGTVAHLSLYVDETSEAVLASGGWHLPATHWLEAWGDARSFDGTRHLAQPLINPLYGGKSSLELIGTALAEEGHGPSGEDLVRTTFMGAESGGAADAKWRRSLHDGLVAGSAFATATATPGGAAIALAAGAAGIELNLFLCPKVLDGRYANNGWLQELPDAVTKLTWDNALYLGVATAKRLGLITGSKAKLAANGAEVETAVYVMAGHAEDSASLALGYGRTSAGVIAGFKAADVASAGFDGYPVRTLAAPAIVADASVSKLRGTYQLATTQEHHLIDAVGMAGRAERLPLLAREGSVQEWEQDHDFAKQRVHLPKDMRSLFDPEIYDGQHQWGMTIDLAACNGCNSCVIACQSENNIPIVGKEQVSHGREMHWMRVDFYFQGDAQDAETVDAVGQPVNCLQCENAPCEQVCPVAATVHSQEGLNDMVYNRCIGTRYCGNNCPAKVRRFNYFHYTKFMDKPGNKVLQLAMNPDVTVRSRGVMEKCTYCIQRISIGRIKARNEGRLVEDGEVVTSCQTACPPNAITFGNILDESSAVAAKRSVPRAYAMLEELNIRPRTLYMAKVSNLNESLAGSWDPAAKVHKDGAMPQGQYAAGSIPAVHVHAGHADGGHGSGDEHGEHAAENGGGH